MHVGVGRKFLTTNYNTFADKAEYAAPSTGTKRRMPTENKVCYSVKARFRAQFIYLFI